MRLLLPPSEGKAPGGRGAPLAPDRFGAGPLGEHRRALCAAVEALADGPRATALAAFRLPPAVADAALRANGRVSSAGTRRALDRYAGVVYDGLAVASMSPAERRVAQRSLLIFSGLFGVLTATEAVPDYRVPATAVLPGLGSLTAFWRPRLAPVMTDRLGRRGLVVDMRSTDYAAMWRPDPIIAGRLVVVRVLSPRPDGTPGIISYNSKLAKGRLAAALIAREAAGEAIGRAEDVAAVWQDLCDGTASIIAGGGPIRLDLFSG